MITASIEFNALNQENAQRVSEVLNGRTFYNFRAYWYSYPCKGNERVVVETEYEGATEADIMPYVLSLLAVEI